MQYKHPEIVGGFVPLSDMSEWMEELQKEPGSFTPSEVQDFFSYHFAAKISDCISRGLTEAECTKEITKEIASTSNQLDEKIANYIKSAVSTAYEVIFNE